MIKTDDSVRNAVDRTDIACSSLKVEYQWIVGGGAGGEACDEERGTLGADGGAPQVLKRTLGALNGAWVPRDTRDEVAAIVGIRRLGSRS